MVSFGKNSQPQPNVGMLEVVVQSGSHDTLKWFFVSIYPLGGQDGKRLGAMFVKSCCDEHAADQAIEFSREHGFIPPKGDYTTSVADMNGDRPILAMRGKFLDGREVDYAFDRGAEYVRKVYLMTPEQIAREPVEQYWFTCSVMTMSAELIGYYFVKSDSQANATTEAGKMYRDQVLAPKKKSELFSVRTSLTRYDIKPCDKFVGRLVPLDELTSIAGKSEKDFLAALNGERTV